uniref:DNA topoisomerase I DNA binding eukaryotic-type domain-containing protein n=1 Tax=Crocodylus porosus TaxID=8502 RepID=A0A7M4EEZ8_CROPO
MTKQLGPAWEGGPLETYLSCERLPADASGKFTCPLMNYRWEERKYKEGIKWKFLEHQGPLFAPAYDPLPDDVKFHYNAWQWRRWLTFFAKMLDHEYTTKKTFCKNFFEMTIEERMLLINLTKCDFNEMATYYKRKIEEKKILSKKEKLVNTFFYYYLKLKIYAICI